MLMLPMRDGTGQSTSKDRATQLLICEPLSFAIYSRDTNETYILHRHLKYSRHFRHPPDTNKTPMD